MKQTKIWTDGCCFPNPGTGGWAWISEDATQDSGRRLGATNQQMELEAVLAALRAFTGRDVEIISDSQYVIKGATEWIQGWVKRGWKNASKKPVENQEQWKALLSLTEGRVVKFTWVKGHSGDAMNEKADALASAATGLPTEEIKSYEARYR
jgi:ribonuclease HI